MKVPVTAPRTISILTIILFFVSSYGWADEAKDSFQKYPYVHHLSRGDGYFELGIGLFLPKKGQYNLLDFQFNSPIYRNGKFQLLIETEFFIPHDQNTQPLYISSHTELRFRYNLHPNIKPFGYIGVSMIRGEDRPQSETGLLPGVGAEFFWESKKYPTALYSILEMGPLFEFDGSTHLNINSRLRLFLWKFRLAGENYFTLNFDAEAKYATNSPDLGLFVRFGPRFGFLFPNKQEISLQVNWLFNRGYPFLTAPDTEKYSQFVGVHFQAPMGENLIFSDSEMGGFTRSPNMNIAITLGAGGNFLLMSDIDVDLVIPIITRNFFRWQFKVRYDLARYFREGPDLSLHTFETGPRFLFRHPSDRSPSHAPYWTLGGYFKHRSEHLSNPPPGPHEATGTNPESLVVQVSSPYWDDQVWNEYRSQWIDYLSLNLVFNKFMTVSDPDDPRVHSSFSIRPGISVNMARIGQGLLYIRGEKSFFGHDLVDWRAELGWKRRNWAVFARAEDLGTFGPLAGESRIDYYMGWKFYFSMIPEK